MSEGLRELAGHIDRGKPTHIVVAGAIRRQITLGRLQPGDSLPPERELAQWFGVGRTTLRKAIRELAEEGWVETRLGRGGGTVVLEAGIRNGVDPRRMFEQTGIAVEHTYEVRLALEPLAAGLAAERATEEQTRALFEILKEPATTVNMYHSMDSRLHTKIAEASQNPLLLDAIEVQREGFFTWANALWLNADWHGLRVKWGDPERAFEMDHRQIIEAIASKDSQGARCGMEQHLKVAREQFRELLGRVFYTET